MGYLFLTIALFAGVTKGYCGKKTSYAVKLNSDSMIINVLRMLVCIAIGLALMAINGELAALKLDNTMLFAAILSGVASAGLVISWLLSVKSGAYMMVEVFLLMGVLVPIALCRVFFNESITLWQVFGIALLMVAVYFICTYNASIKGKMSIGALLLLVLVGVSNGLADFSQKMFVKTSEGGSIAAFNMYTYVFASVVLLVTYFIFRSIDKKAEREVRAPLTIIKPIWIYVLIMAICLFANSFFKTKAALTIDAAKLYPLSQGGSVILALLMSSILLKEKVNAKCIVGICLAFVALLLINLDISAILGL